MSGGRGGGKVQMGRQVGLGWGQVVGPGWAGLHVVLCRGQGGAWAGAQGGACAGACARARSSAWPPPAAGWPRARATAPRAPLAAGWGRSPARTWTRGHRGSRQRAKTVSGRACHAQGCAGKCGPWGGQQPAAGVSARMRTDAHGAAPVRSARVEANEPRSPPPCVPPTRAPGLALARASSLWPRPPHTHARASSTYPRPPLQTHPRACVQRTPCARRSSSPSGGACSTACWCVRATRVAHRLPRAPPGTHTDPRGRTSAGAGACTRARPLRVHARRRSCTPPLTRARARAPPGRACPRAGPEPVPPGPAHSAGAREGAAAGPEARARGQGARPRSVRALWGRAWRAAGAREVHVAQASMPAASCMALHAHIARRPPRAEAAAAPVLRVRLRAPKDAHAAEGRAAGERAGARAHCGAAGAMLRLPVLLCVHACVPAALSSRCVMAVL